MNNEIKQFNKFMNVLKDIQPELYHVLKNKNIEVMLNNIEDVNTRKLLLALISIMSSKEHRKKLIKGLKDKNEKQ